MPPPLEGYLNYQNGLIVNANAMSREYLENDVIKSYVENPNCTVILFENPPYRDQVANNSKQAGKSIRRDFMLENLKDDLKNLPNSNISTARDISNQFIWSAWKYYLTKPHDAYILFSPIKYWKTLGLSNRKFCEGYLLNRKFFHATPSAIACILWKNEEDHSEKIVLPAYDIVDGNSVYVTDVTVKKCHKTFKELFDKRTFDDDEVTSVYCNADGTEAFRKCDGKSYRNKNILGYIQPTGFSVDPKHIALVRCTIFNIRGFYLREDNFLKKLPLFCAKEYPQDEWYHRDVYFNTADGGTSYEDDDDFLRMCLIFTCLSNQNKCLSFIASDGHMYQNELCFDNGTLASRCLEKMSLSDDEKKLLYIWKKLLDSAKRTKQYDSRYKYGPYQINRELNTQHEETSGTRVIKVPDYPELNGNLNTLKSLLKTYYSEYIVDKLFEYELLK